jgi:hypothetical protein
MGKKPETLKSRRTEKMSSDPWEAFGKAPATQGQRKARFEAAVACTPTDLKSYNQAVYYVGGLGRNDIPHLLWRWHLRDMRAHARDILTPELLRLILENAWSMPEAPEYWVTSYFWVPWFRRAGFLSDKHHTQPTEPLKVYRGVCPAHCGRIRRMSWTADLRTAVWFAYR